MQSMANAAGSTAIQTEVNRRGAATLRAYHSDLVRIFPEWDASSMVGGSRSSGINAQGYGKGGVAINNEVASLLDALDAAVEHQGRLRDKDVEMLLIGCDAARLMHAARTTSCKSAKDRSSCFHTLEISRVAERFGLLHRFLCC